MVERLTVRPAWRRIATELRPQSTFARAAWETAGTVALNGGGFVAQLTVTLMLTRMLGADGYGAYAFALAWAFVLASPAMLGLTPLIVRSVAAYSTRGSWHLIRGIIHKSHQVVLVTSCAIVAVAALVAWLAADRSNLLVPFLIALPLVPLISLTAMRQAAMQGLGHVILGRTPEVLILPALLLAAVAIAYISLGDGITSEWVLALNVGAATISFMIGGLLLSRMLKTRAQGAQRAYEMRSWVSSALPFLVSSIAIAVNAQVGTIAVGTIGTAAEAGVFNSALRIALIVGFLSLAATYSFQPLAARLYAQGRISELEHVLAKAGRILLLAAAVVSAVIIVLAKPLLGLFGEAFEVGYTIVWILVAGELVRIAMGYSNLALVMTNHEKAAMVAFCVGTGVNIALTFALVPVWGAEGAALGLACGNAVWGALATILLWRKMRIRVAGILPRRR